MKLAQLQEATYYKQFDMRDKKQRLYLKHYFRDLVDGTGSGGSKSYNIKTDLPPEEVLRRLIKELGPGDEPFRVDRYVTRYRWDIPGAQSAIHFSIDSEGSHPKIGAFYIYHHGFRER